MTISQRIKDLRRGIAAATAAIACIATAPGAAAARFFDPGPARHFLELEVHATVGTSTVIQNYDAKFAAITEFQMSPGFAAGAGAKVTFGLRDWLGLATELNATLNNSSASMAIAGDGATPASTLFLHNHYYVLKVPVYLSLRFNVSDNVRWNVEGGIYYALGLGGSQKQSIYSSYINDLGQLVNIHANLKTGYYNDPDAFINSSYRSDWGVHIGTSFDLGRHATVGFRTQIGVKNIANISDAGITRPSVHNVTAMGCLGWRF